MDDESDPEEVPATVLFHSSREKNIMMQSVSENIFQVGQTVAVETGLKPPQQRFWIGR